MDMVRCVVLNCSSWKKTENAKISHHRFPKDPEILKLWIEFSGRKKFDYGCNWRMCNLHFDSNQFSNTFRFRLGYSRHHYLKPNAIPTLHPPTIKPDKETVSNCSNVAAVSTYETPEAKLKSFKFELETYKAKLKSFNFENALLKKINEDLGKEVFDLKAKNLEAEQTINSLRQQLDASVAERFALQMKIAQSNMNQANANSVWIAGVKKTDDFETQLPLYYIDNSRLYASPACQNSSELKSDFNIHTGIIEEVKTEPED